MRNYKQLSQSQRYQIEILNKARKNQKQTAELLGVSGSTVCRELKRNQGKKGLLPEAGTDKSGSAQETGCKSAKNDRRSDR